MTTFIHLRLNNSVDYKMQHGNDRTVYNFILYNFICNMQHAIQYKTNSNVLTELMLLTNNFDSSL